MRGENIPNGELFADLQISLTEIVLAELIRDEHKRESFQKRATLNGQIVDEIKRIMQARFSDVDLIEFLEVGFPRQVNLGRTIIKETERQRNEDPRATNQL